MIIDYVTHTITTWQRNDKASLREEQKGGGVGGGGGCREQREPKVGAIKKKRIDYSDAPILFSPQKYLQRDAVLFHLF
jgi:hypothetical protein